MKDKYNKNPVLTSPWKIGMLVALLLLVVGFGTVYFMVRVYDVELAWLEGSLLSWEVDSFAFFKEMYPLAAGVLVLSLIAYFTVASAVRRYRCYLDSGQDYRRLVRLADSIDDLTNPAQIARLKNYPELQSVLRNYGDQIREISSQLSEQQSQEDQRSVDFEMEIDTLLQGEATQDSLVEDRWWTPLYRKIETYVQEMQKNINELNKKIHDGKTALGRVALSTGRIVEQIGGTADDYSEIMRAVSELNGIAENMGASGEIEDGESPGADKGHLKAVVTEMENTLHKLEDGGKVLNEFSEENNGLALNIALMAAKGEASEHELAQFAEKVRSTADRFNRLSATFTSMAQGLLGTCYSLKEKLDIDTGSDEGGNNEMKSSIASIAKMLEERFTQMQERICYIGNEVHDAQDLVNRSVRNIAAEQSGEEQPGAGDDLSMASDDEELILERSGNSLEDGADEDLVIDHGRLWGEEDVRKEDVVSLDDQQAEGFPLDDIDADSIDEPEPVEEPGAEEFEEPAGMEESGAAEEEEKADTSDMEPEGDSEEKEFTIPPAEETPSAGTDEAWGDTAQHKWFKIDIDKEEETAEATSEEIEVRETADIASEETEAVEAPDVAVEGMEPDVSADIPFGGTEPDVSADIPFEGTESEAAADISMGESVDTKAPVDPGMDQPTVEEAAADEEDGEPIYDLYELGAVEYVEETMSQG